MSATDGEIQNSKHEIRNNFKNQIQMLNTEWCKFFVLNFLFNSFGFVSDFEIRISNFWSLWMVDVRRHQAAMHERNAF
jgi:hypothetical protein